MFTTYFDASGTRLDSDIVTLAGFTSDVTQWMKFEEEWTEVLRAFGVPYLHMKEFAHFKGPFGSWKGQEQKRIDLLGRLSAVIKRRTHKGFCRSIRVGDFEVFDRDYPIRETIGTPLAIAGLTCVAAVILWLRKYGDQDDPVFAFEDGDQDKAFLTRALQMHSGINPVYRRKGQHVQFQAADGLAYENRIVSSRWIHNNEHMGQSEYRKSISVLADRISHDEWGDIGADEFDELRSRLHFAA
jgi:hypothetical protein